MVEDRSSASITIELGGILPEYPEFVAGIRRAPHRGYSLSQHDGNRAQERLTLCTKSVA